MKTISHVLYLIILLSLLSGCWDQTNIDQRAYVVAIGIDKSEEDEGKVNITYLISNPELSKQEGGSNEPNSEIITYQAPDLITAKEMANTVVAKEISYTMISAILVSEEMAKENQFVRWMYDLTKDREFSRGIPLVVTKEKTSEFLKENEPQLETRIHKYFELILKYGSQNGYIADNDLLWYFKITEEDADLFVAPYATTKSSGNDGEGGGEEDFLAGELKIEGETNKTQFLGSALFKEGKMIAKITGEETRAAILLNDTLNMQEFLTTYSDPFNDKYHIGARVTKGENNTVEIDVKKSNPTIDVTVPLYMDILSNHSMVDYSNDKKKREALKKHITNELTKKLENFVRKTQEEYKSEPFGWSLFARKHFKTIPEYVAYDWMDKYPTMKVNINVDITFGKFGRQGEMPDLKEVRD